MERQTDKKIKTLRSNRGGEYMSKEFEAYLQTEGIARNLTQPLTPQ